MTESEAERSEIFSGIAGCLHRLAKSKHFLTRAQCLALAEEARNLADELDHGEGDRMQQQLRRRKFALIAESGPFGRPWFRLL
jgi:hypothetical protein